MCGPVAYSLFVLLPAVNERCEYSVEMSHFRLAVNAQPLPFVFDDLASFIY